MKQIIRFERPTKKIEMILPDEGELEDLSFEDIWINPLDNLEEVKSSKPSLNNNIIQDCYNLECNACIDNKCEALFIPIRCPTRKGSPSYIKTPKSKG